MFAPGRTWTKRARLVGRQAQMIAIWHSITDQWFRGSISTGSSSTPGFIRAVGSERDLQVGFVLEVFRENTTTRTIPIAVNLSQCQHAHNSTTGGNEEQTYTNPIPNMTATPIFFCTDKFNLDTS